MKLKNAVMPVLILLFCGAVLLSVSGLTAKAAANAETVALTEVMTTLLPGSTTFTPEEYTGKDENIKAVYKADSGYVIKTTVMGYVDEITLLIGVRNDGSIAGLTVLDAAETRGLGQRILKDRFFLGQYLGTTGDAAVGETIDVLSGATVTSKAVTKAVNSAAAFVTGADAASSATEWSG